MRDHVAHRAGVHPSVVLPARDLASATVVGRRQDRYVVEVERDDRTVTVRDVGAS